MWIKTTYEDSQNAEAMHSTTGRRMQVVKHRNDNDSLPTLFLASISAPFSNKTETVSL